MARRHGNGPGATDLDRNDGSTAALSLFSDTTLILGITRGNREALPEIYERHSTHAHSLACQICGADRADDVVQHVFLRLWQRPGASDIGPGSLRSYLMTMTCGRAIDVLRAHTSGRNRAPAAQHASAHRQEHDHSGTLPTRSAHDATDLLSRLPSHNERRSHSRPSGATPIARWPKPSANRRRPSRAVSMPASLDSTPLITQGSPPGEAGDP